MDLTPHVNNLGREFATLAETGGEEARTLVERLTGALESAIRMTLLDALSAAADEISRDLAPGSVEVRLRGRDPSFVVTLPAGPASDFAPGFAPDFAHNVDTGAAVGSAAGTVDADLLVAEDGPAARINVRLPEQLKTSVEAAAAKEGRSVNAWLVRAAAAALQRSDRDQRPEPHGGGRRSKQGFTGWVR
ncbi:toxin-antitoxin system HicB family antitoxin [Jatrophihabitans sp. GAS493]|uniref:toxin-antitoxin system HicB family antitoxin n=1 Tax=Jatrophihabitans sp. GAS493 TaxID=1907575 RepID=UPI000BB842FD|nr:toxin-antitoxin system HicB family antitoxin [Jatrophihabitans sp. GAS493]